MKLSILSLRGVEFEETVSSLNVATESGEVTVLDHHRPMISLLKKGVARIIAGDGARREFTLQSGFLEVGSGNSVRMLIR
jgi:F0F1-type ATP synthase epsilon subunit